jgi:hypothetical protein
MFLVGNATDQITSLIWGYLSRQPFTVSNPVLASYTIYQNMFFSFTQPWLSNEPLFFLVMSLLGTFLGPVAYNFYLITVSLFNFWAFWYTFRKYKFWWFGALVFNLSPYYYLHFAIHPDLMHIWAFPLFYKLYSEQKYKIIPFFILLVTLFSNYIGFCLIILMCTLIVSKVILLAYEHKLNLNDVGKDVLLIIVTGLLLLIFLFRFVAMNYFKENNSTVDPYVVNRSVIDFTIFSAKPWYFFIPSEKNPILGNIAKFENHKLTQINNYLFHQYYPEEHVSLYLGLALYLALIIALIDKAADRKLKLLTAISLVIIFVAMLPPVITVKGQVIYLPSYILFKAFPIFRVTTRLVLALHLVIVVYLMHYFEIRKPSKLVAILTFLILVETFVPIKLRTVYAPREYEFISENTADDAFLSVYPYSKAREALLWLPIHKRKLANVPGVFIKGYDARAYTENLLLPDSPAVEGYILVDNRFVKQVPQIFELVETFENSTLYSKK